MPTTAINIPALPDVPVISAAKAAVSSVDNFLALLNTGGAQQDHDSAGDDHPPAKDYSKDMPNPQGAMVTVPVPVVTVDKQNNNAEPVKNVSPDSAPVPSDDTLPQAPQQPQDASAPQQPQQDNQANAPSKTQAANNAQQKSPVQASASDTTISQDIAQAEAQLRAGLQDQLSAIGQIVQAFIQALSTGAATPVLAATQTATVTQTTTSANTPAVINPAVLNPVVLPIQAQLQQLLAPVAFAGNPVVATGNMVAFAGNPVAVPTPDVATPVVNLLQDVQSLLQQLQQTLAPVATNTVAVQTLGPVATNTAAIQTSDTLQTLGPVATNTAAIQTPDNLQTLTDSLRSDIGKLTQLLKQQANNDVAVNTPSLPSLGNLGALLKDSIAQVRDQLQKLQNQNDTIFAQAKANFEAQIASALGKVPSTADIKDTFASANIIAANNNVVSTPVVPHASTSDTALLAAVPVVSSGLTQGGMNNSGSNSSGSGSQDQGLPQPVLGTASTGQASSTGNAGSVSFAKVLGQTSQSTVLEQVIVNIKTAVSDGSSKIRIQLDPADLGKLDIKISVGADGKTGVTIAAENRSTLDLLQRDAQGLARALNDIGLTTDSGNLSFSLNGGQQQDQDQTTSQAALTYQSAQPEEDTSISAITRSYVVNLAQGLDITI